TYALNAQTGQFIWSYQTDGNLYSSAAVVNGVAYFGSYDGNMYAVGQLASSSGMSSLVYYAVVVVVIVIAAVIIAVLLLRRRH
ncbi:MAG: hypothetical protein ACXV2C_05025, partial [Candidatus Bathyarchaeia archaeon]